MAAVSAAGSCFTYFHAFTVILTSGYPSPCAAHMQLLKDAGPVPLPSMHVYGAGGDDRQVPAAASEQLMQWYAWEYGVPCRMQEGIIYPVTKRA